jgi:PAP2 superfamily
MIDASTDRSMASPEETAFRLHALNWLVLGMLAACFALSLLFVSFRLTAESVAYSYGICLSVGAFAWWRFRQTAPARLRTTFVIGAQAQVLLTTVILAPSTYVAASLGLPLQDEALVAIDRALGLEWRAYLDFVNTRPWLGDLLGYGYRMIQWPIFAIPLILGMCGHVLRLNQYVLAFALTLAVTTVVSAFVPAVAGFAHFGLTPADYPNLRPLADSNHLPDLRSLRAGMLAVLDIREVLGIVTFPSFHAASCLLYAWAFWPIWWMRPVALLANGLMLAATPIDGGHYFIDVFAGLAIAAAAIWFAGLISRRLACREQRQTDYGALVPRHV